MLHRYARESAAEPVDAVPSPHQDNSLSPYAQETAPIKKSVIAVLVLAVFSYAANAADLTLFNSISFIFGSIFAIAALRLVGLPAAVFVAFVGGIYTVFAWGHYFALITVVCEVACVGYLLRRMENVVLADMVFWAAIGLPLVAFFYVTGLDLSFESGSFIAIKQAVNAVFNAVLAGLLLFLLRVTGLSKALMLGDMTLRAMMFKVVAFVGVTSTVVIIILESRAHYQQAIDNIERLSSAVSTTVARTISETGEVAPLEPAELQRLRDLFSLSTVTLEPLRDLSVSVIAPDGDVTVLLGDPTFSRSDDDTEFYSPQFGRWSPPAEMPEMQRSLDSRYIHVAEVATTDFDGVLTIELSAIPVINFLESDGRQNLLLMATITILILSVTHVLISWLVSPLSVLSSASRQMGNRIISGEKLEPLPTFHLRELDELAGTMGGMADSLSESFKKQDDLARTLEQRVKERTEQLSLMSRVAQQTTDAVVITDDHGLTTWVNRSFERLTGYKLEEMLGKSPGSVLQKQPPAEHVLENMRTSLARADSFHVELVNHKKDGTPFWLEIRCSPMVGSDGRHTGFIAIETDITERRDLTRSLNTSLQRLQLATEAAELGVWVYYEKTKKLDWNDLNYKLHGFDETATDDLLSFWLAHVFDEDRGLVEGIFDSDIYEGGTTKTLEYRFVCRERGIRTMIATFGAFRTSDGDKRVAGVTRDVTEERNTQREIEETASHTRAILDNVIDGVIAIDVEGKITSFNKAAEKMFGYTAEELLGNDISILMMEEHAISHSGFVKTYLSTGRKKVMGRLTDFRAQRKDGSVFPILLGVTEVKTKSSHFFIGIIRDASAEKQLQEQLRQSQKLEAVRQLTGGISHDFNNLLTVILGSAEMLADQLDDRPELKRSAELVLSAAERGAELTSRLLAFSRRQALSPKVADISLLLDGMHELLERSIGQLISIEITTKKEECLVKVDTGQFEAAILNLALNSRDAMPDGGTLKIEITERTISDARDREDHDLPDGEYFSVAVSDTGAGMDDNQLIHAFEPFYTTKDVGRGSGLGLSMVFGFVKQSEGHISIASKIGEGTKVELLFPAVSG